MTWQNCLLCFFPFYVIEMCIINFVGIGSGAKAVKFPDIFATSN